MKEGVYIVAENGETIGIVKFAGTDPFLMIAGSFDVVEFNRSGQTKQLPTIAINNIRAKSTDYSFVLLVEYEEQTPTAKVVEFEITPKKIKTYREYYNSCHDRLGLIMKIMAELKLTHSEATTIVEKYVINCS